MEDNFVFSGIIFRGGDEYFSLCLDLDISSKGETIEEAKKNLISAVSDFSKRPSEERKSIMFQSLDAETNTEGIRYIVEEFFFRNSINLLSHANYSQKHNKPKSPVKENKRDFVLINNKKIDKKYFLNKAEV